MANNYLLYSEWLPLKSEEEQGFIEELIGAVGVAGDYGDAEALSAHTPEIQALAKEICSGDTYEFEYRIEGEGDKLGAWLYAEEYGSPYHLVRVVHELFKKFNRDDEFTLTWAETCSKPRVGEFGGGAAVVTKDGWEIMHTSGMVDQLSAKLKAAKNNGDEKRSLELMDEAMDSYLDGLDPEVQIDAEEMVSSLIFDASAEDETGWDEELCNQLGKDILRMVLKKFRPDLFKKQNGES